MVYSFDVFDTVITRNTATPKGVFMLLQNRLEQDALSGKADCFFCRHFADIRTEAERLAREQAHRDGKEEICIKDIYDMISYVNHIERDVMESVMKLEIEEEYHSALPVSDMINHIKHLRDEGHDIYLISDMYLGTEDIRRMLLKCDSFFSEIPLIVSNEYNKTKRSGTLFDVFLKEFGINCGEWVHIGDNPVSDVANVNMRGGKGVLYKRGLYLNTMDNDTDSVEMQLVRGAIKYLSNSKENTNRKIGRTIAAPMLYGYCKWLLSDAENSGIERLYYIARDGFILKSICDIIIKQSDISIETRYLYGSRLAWKMPVRFNDKEGLSHWMRTDFTFRYLKELSDYFNLSDEEIEGFLKGFIGGYDLYRRLSHFEMYRYINHLACNDEFLSLCFERADSTNKKAHAHNYLKQEIGAANGKVAFVEMKGSGATQHCLVDLLGEERRYPYLTYFFTVTHTEVVDTSKCILRKYIQRTPKNTDMNLMEILTRAPHGQTLGYIFDDDKNKWEPVLSDSVRDIPDKKAFEEYQEGIIEYVALLSKYDNYNIDYLDYCNESLDILSGNPDDDFMEFARNMLFESGWISSRDRYYAPALSDDDIVKLAFDNKLYNSNEWYEGGNVDLSKRGMTEEQRKVYSVLKNKYGSYSFYNNKLLEGIKLQGNIVLYGAGKYGKEIEQIIKKRANSNLVCWVDRNYNYYQKQGMDVQSPETIPEQKYDMVIIAIANPETAYSVRKYLISIGVDNKLII